MMGMSGRRDPNMSPSRANSHMPFRGAGLTNVRNARVSLGASTAHPVDRRFDRRAQQAYLLHMHITDMLAAGEHVVDVLEITTVVVPVAAHAVDRDDAAFAGGFQPQQNHGMRITGDDLIGHELVEDFAQQREICAVSARRENLRRYAAF